MKTWTENGVPYAETRRRLGERSNNECREAYKWFRRTMPAAARKTILGIADKLRDTLAVLEIYEPLWIKGLEKDMPDMGAIEMHGLLEGNALAIEHHVRQLGRK